MKKYIAIFAAAALALSLSACANSATKEPASSAASTAQATRQPTAEVTKEPAAQTPEATLPDGQTKSPDHFQDLASLDLIRDVTAKSASMVEFTYKYAPGYEGKKITGFTVQSAAISGEDMQFDVKLLTNDEGVAVVTVQGEFEEDEIYPFIINLTAAYEDGSESPIIDFFSYESESFTEE